MDKKNINKSQRQNRLDMVDFKRLNNLGKLRQDIEAAINKNSMENGSDTPDFILAQYLTDCLKAFDSAVARRTIWYEKPPKQD